MPLIPRLAVPLLGELLATSPAVGLLGPRQVGKSTFARQIAQTRDSIYLDLQLRATRTQLTEPELFLRANADRLVIFDEVQRAPDLFSTLRPIIDEDRRPGRFLLLGSASPKLMRAASESLAGRIFYTELTPLTLSEARLGGATWEVHLVAGGYPQVLLDLDDRGRRRWIDNYLTTFVTRDLAELGIIPNAQEFERLLSLLAHVHGGVLNASELSRSLRVSAPTVQKYVDLLEGAFLIRTLRPYSTNAGKRITKSPRVYYRDSGLRHGLLGIYTYNELLLHPALGSSWEGYAIEEVCRAFAENGKPCFYRTAKGDELDLVLELSSTRRLAFEMKFSTGPTLSAGTYRAIEDVQPERTFVITPESMRAPLREDIEVCSLTTFLDDIAPDYY